MNTTLKPVAASDFTRAISRAATPVTIVTTEAGQVWHGQTVSALSRVSDDPAVLGVCINRRSPINDVIRRRGAFNVSVLGREHGDVADCFAGRPRAGRTSYTFVDSEWQPGRNRLPVFTDGVASFECDLRDVTTVGSHHLYLGEVLCAAHTDAEPLLHLRGNYRTLAALDTEGKYS